MYKILKDIWRFNETGYVRNNFQRHLKMSKILKIISLEQYFYIISNHLNQFGVFKKKTKKS